MWWEAELNHYLNYNGLVGKERCNGEGLIITLVYNLGNNVSVLLGGSAYYLIFVLIGDEIKYTRFSCVGG